jgi:hypothetical protein
MVNLRQRLRDLSPHHDLTSVIVHAFDHRTRMLPFIFADRRMAPAGARAIGSAMFDIGFEKTPWHMKLDGRVPDLFMVSSMPWHSAACDRLIRQACQIDAADRPLIIVGGPLTPDARALAGVKAVCWHLYIRNGF